MLGALAPRTRSTNQKAQIATKARTKYPPHVSKVDAALVSITSSVVVAETERALIGQSGDSVIMRVGGRKLLINRAHTSGMYFRLRWERSRLSNKRYRGADDDHGDESHDDAAKQFPVLRPVSLRELSGHEVGEWI